MGSLRAARQSGWESYCQPDLSASTRARGAPPVSYGVTARGRLRYRDWPGGLGLAHSRLGLSKFAAALAVSYGSLASGSVEFRVMIYRDEPRVNPICQTLRTREASCPWSMSSLR